MRRFANLKQLHEIPLPSSLFGALARALRTEEEIAHPEPCDPENGSVWLLQSTDTDATVAEIFGAPLTALAFERVAYHPDHEHFLCHLVINNSRCDTLVIPDAHWLPDAWRERLLGQM